MALQEENVKGVGVDKSPGTCCIEQTDWIKLSRQFSQVSWRIQMVRALRIEFPYAVYHITARGNARKDIFLADSHRHQFLDYLAKTVERYNWLCHAYCLMSNHYPLLIETIDPTLSDGMKYLNGSYSQYFNQSQRRVGHVFQGQYKGILVEKEDYLLELSRYIVLNPVRAKMVARAED